MISCTSRIMVAWSSATIWDRARRCISMTDRLISSKRSSLTMLLSTMVPALAWTLLMLNTARILDSRVIRPSRIMGRIRRC